MLRAALPSFLAVLVLGSRAGAQAPAPRGPTREDYAAAVALLEPNLRGLVKNQAVEPHWLGDKGAFWYRRDEATGWSWVLVDPAGKKTPLFDPARLAAALGPALGTAAPAPTALDLGQLSVTDDRATLTATVQTKRVSCDLKAMTCRALDPAPPPDPGRLLSPDGTKAVSVKDNNLVLTDLASGKETSLTTDGATHYAYGSLTDQSLITIPLRKSKLRMPPASTTWSPDGRYLLAARVDERQLRVDPFVEWVPQDGSLRPVVHEIRSAFTGDREQPKSELVSIDVATGRAMPVVGPADLPGMSPDPVGWSGSRHQAFLIGRSEGGKSAGLLRVDLATGQVTPVLTETSDTRVETNSVEYNWPNVRIVADGAEAIWYSARSGFGHLYRYDAQTGTLLNPITSGDWSVFDVITVDEKGRDVYLTAGGREPGRDPYYRHLYRARLDGKGVALVTDADADHQFDPPSTPMIRILFRTPDRPPLVRPDLGLVVDTYSTVGTPPVTVLRRIDGRVVAELERADPSALFAAGWKPPIREKVLGADGKTDLYVTYQAPRVDLGSPLHPVIDAEYGGPQVIVTPRNFVDAYSAANPLGESSLARLGFAVVTVDGRGTPYRSRAFRDAGYPNFTQVGVDDHVAAIKQLARRHPEIDTTRVGVYGISWGGTFAAQAILSRPEFYDVAVSGAGVYNYAVLYGGFDNFIGIPRYADGSTTRTKPEETPANWKPLDITALAPNLRGHLLLTYGDLDENVPPVQVFRLIDALIKANKPYDLVYLPGRNHGGNADPYAVRRTWDYFIEHLLGAPLIPDVAVTMKGR